MRSMFILLSLAVFGVSISRAGSRSAAAVAAAEEVPRPPAADAPAADLIVTNARVHTVDKAKPEAEAVAVIGERIVAVGGRAEINTWRGPRTKVIDAAGRRLLPGFDDAHVHFISGGTELDSVSLKDAPSRQEFVKRIGARVTATPKGEWVLGGDWDETLWTPQRLPDRTAIDAVSPDTPVFVSRYDGHMALANSLALKLAGVTRETVDPAGGVIVRDAEGRPNGLFKDAAMDLVEKVIPQPTHERRMRAAKRALEHAASLGVTSVQDMNPEFADIAVYSELQERGELTTRISAAPLITHSEDLVKIGIRRSFGSPFLRIGALKGYADGSLGSLTAYFFE
ncbi:MAG TPA: amidohydrolase family protein, partial [Candidatus Polarisedimenticolia bacterium]|nr:amidohydrolase family protein [Candidatus Polarisedimenticolia bacterium]